MEKIRAIISSNLDKHQHFEEYFKIIEIIEANETKNPDISIESSKALVEGISKTILINLDNAKTPSNIDTDDLPKIFKNAMRALSNECEAMEADFVARFSAIIQVLGELRNKRGDVSHGRMAPKVIFSSPQLASTVKNMTESILEYVLEHYFSLDFSLDNTLDYYSKEIEPYNDWLDDSLPFNFPIKKAKYSKLLFENDPDEYESRYSDEYLPSLEDIDFLETTSGVVREKTELIDKISGKEEVTPKETPFAENAEEPALEIENLVNTFKEEIFWTDSRHRQLQLFTEVENLRLNKIKQVINGFLFTGKEPLRDEVVDAMQEKPTLKKRAEKTTELTTKIIELANELKTL